MRDRMRSHGTALPLESKNQRAAEWPRVLCILTRWWNSGALVGFWNSNDHFVAVALNFHVRGSDGLRQRDDLLVLTELRHAGLVGAIFFHFLFFVIDGDVQCFVIIDFHVYVGSLRIRQISAKLEVVFTIVQVK